MEEDLLRAAAGFWLLLSLLAAAPGRAEEPAEAVELAEPPSPLERQGLFPEEEEQERESLFAYFKERTKLTFGGEIRYDSNVFLQDNKKQGNLIIGTDPQIFFVDSKGSLQYGATLEGNFERHTSINREVVDWQGSAFLDFDPGGLYAFQLTYRLDASNSLVRAEENTDFFRRGTDFQRAVAHDGSAKVSYALNSRDKWINTVSFSVLDDQVTDDSGTDRRTLGFFSTLDREIRPAWTLSGGYELQKLDVPGKKTRSYVSHLGRISLLHELTDDFELKGTFKYGLRSFHLGSNDTVATFEGVSRYPLLTSPRLTVNLDVTRVETASYAATSTQSSGNSLAPRLEYELTPLVTLSGGYSVSRGRSSGGGVPDSFTRTYGTNAWIKWQINPKLTFLLGHLYTRSGTRDTTQHKIFADLKGEF